MTSKDPEIQEIYDKIKKYESPQWYTYCSCENQCESCSKHCLELKTKFDNKSSNERYMLTLRNIKELLNYRSTSEKQYLHKLSTIITSHKITKNISMKK